MSAWSTFIQISYKNNKMLAYFRIAQDILHALALHLSFVLVGNINFVCRTKLRAKE
jgi:hypothetical protein